MRVLHIEDNPADQRIFQRLIARMPREWNIELVCARNTHEVDDHIQSGPFDVVFVDYRLGSLDGVALISSLRVTGCRAAFVLLTGQGNEKIAELASEAGAVSYLTKDRLTQYRLEQALARVRGSIMENSRLSGLLKVRDAELSGKRAYLKAIHDSVMDAIIVINEKGNVQSFNPAAEGLFGYSAEEIIGKSVSLLLPEPFASEYDRYLTNYVSQKSEDPIILPRRDLFAKHRDGRLFPIDLGVKEVRLEKNRIFVGVIRDITTRKQFEMALTAARDAAIQANLAKSRFLANMSHDLRTPMHALLNFIDMSLRIFASKKRVEEGADPEQEKLAGSLHKIPWYLQTARESAERLTNLLNDLLDLSKLEAGHLVFSFEPANIQELVSFVIDELTPLAQKRQLRLTVTHMPVDGMLCCDAGRLLQVFQNLVGNAIKFSPVNAGDITLHIKRVPAGDRAREQMEITIRDHGRGIPEEFLDAIFEPFNQVDGRKDAQIGTGLGLAICRRIMDGHGGTITAANNKPQGAVITIRLPVEQSGDAE